VLLGTSSVEEIADGAGNAVKMYIDNESKTDSQFADASAYGQYMHINKYGHRDREHYVTKTTACAAHVIWYGNKEVDN
jgi:hypothetical protein